MLVRYLADTSRTNLFAIVGSPSACGTNSMVGRPLPFGDDVAEIRWNGGVAVAQTDQPEALHGSDLGHGWTYVRVPDPDSHYSAMLGRGGHVLNEPRSDPSGGQRGYSAGDPEGNIWTVATHGFGG